jgi:hypothetical protein
MFICYYYKFDLFASNKDFFKEFVFAIIKLN